MRSELCVFALIAIGTMPPKDRERLDPSDFFGHEDDIKLLQADPKSAVRAIVEREWPDIDWPEDKTLWFSSIERFREICKREKGLSLLEMKSRKLEAAKKVIVNHKANGGLPKSVVEEAEALLIAASEVEAKKEGFVNAD